MSSIAIELNDAEIRLVRDGRAVAVEPGCAAFTTAGLLVGEEAVRVARLRPERVNDRFWADLSQVPLRDPRGGATSAADVAFAQLASLWSRHGSGAEQVVFVVPGSFKREQLGLLLGIAEACSIPVAGLVASAVVSSSGPYPGHQLAHLDIGLHSVVLTTLTQDGGCSVDAVDVLVATGLSALRDRWLAAIGDAFLHQARFDPLHDASADQALFDSLPACLERLRVRDSTRLEIEIRGQRYEAEVKRAALSAAAGATYAPIVDLVRRARQCSLPLALQVSHRLVDLPGLTDVLSSEPRAKVLPIEPSAGCRAALQRLDDIRRPEDSLSLVRRLGWRSVADGA